MVVCTTDGYLNNSSLRIGSTIIRSLRVVEKLACNLEYSLVRLTQFLGEG